MAQVQMAQRAAAPAAAPAPASKPAAASQDTQIQSILSILSGRGSKVDMNA
jgi:hypothetical protein